MTSYFNHKIFPKQKFYLQYFKGVVDMNVAGRAMIDIINEDDFDPSFNTIVDFRDAKMQFTNDEISEFANFLMRRNLVDKDRKIAILTEQPDQPFFVTLLVLLTENDVVNYKIFNTFEDSMEWIEVKRNKERLVRNIMEKLKSDSI